MPSRAHTLLWSLALWTTSAAVLTPFAPTGQMGGAVLGLLWWAYVRPWAWMATRRAFHSAPAALLAWPVGLWDGPAQFGVPSPFVALAVAMIAPLWLLSFYGHGWYARLERFFFPTTGPIDAALAQEVAARCWDEGIDPFDVAVVQTDRQGTFQVHALDPQPPSLGLAQRRVLEKTETWLRGHADAHGLWVCIGTVDSQGRSLYGAPLHVPALPESAHAKLQRAERQGPYGHASPTRRATFAQA